MMRERLVGVAEVNEPKMMGIFGVIGDIWGRLKIPQIGIK